MKRHFLYGTIDTCPSCCLMGMEDDHGEAKKRSMKQKLSDERPRA